MARIGKISVIKKDYSTAFATMETSLRQNGMSMFPGTKRRLSPARKPDGSYITGLTADMQKDLEARFGGDMDLSPRSSFWNVSIPPKDGEAKVQMYPLEDRDHIFVLDGPDAPLMDIINYHWLKVHPMIAKSLEAYEGGEYPADTMFFVNDEEYEEEKRYQKSKLLNEAIIKFTTFSVEKRKKIMRLVGVPVTDDAKEVIVYNLGNDFLKAATIQTGPYKGQTPITVFNKFAEFNDEKIEVADLVEKIIANSIYRVGKGGQVYEGDLKIAQDKESLIEELLTDKGQEHRLELESRLKVKLIAKV